MCVCVRVCTRKTGRSQFYFPGDVIEVTPTVLKVLGGLRGVGTYSVGYPK